MFKKFVTFITLFCFLSTCFVQPAVALDQLVVQKNAEGEYIIPPKCFTDLNMAEFELTHNGVKVGKLSTFLGKMTLEGVDKNSFYLSQIPKLTSLTVNLGGSATFETCVETDDSFSLITQGPSKLLKGFKATKEATFGGAGVEVSGTSSVENLKLKDLQVLTVQKGGSLKADLTQGEGPVKSLKVLGEFKTKLSKSLTLDDTLGCTGSADMGSGDLKVKQIVNHGDLTFDKYKLSGTKLMNLGKLRFGQVTLDMTNTFNQKQIDVANSLVVTGAWQNEKGAVVNVNQLFEGRFSKYQDDGKTFVLGLASISAESGRITGDFLARYGMVEFMSDVLIPETANFQFEKFIRFHTHGNLKLNQGQNTFSLDNRKHWPALVLSPELREKIRPLAPGIFLSAGKDLTRISNVTSTNTAIQFWCSGKYTGQGGITRVGFFDRNNVLITAKSAHLADEIRSFHGFTLQAKMAELLGKREVDGVLGLEVKQLHQDKEDTMKAGTLLAQVDQATLEGRVTYQKGLSVGVKEKMETTDSFKLEAEKGALASIHGKEANVRLGGEFKDVALHTDVKTLRYAENIKGQLTSNNAFAETIVHETKSQLNVEGLNKAVATKGIAVDKEAVVKAENNNLKAGSWIFNAGSIESANQYLADTAIHLNMFGGKVKAHQATVFADVMNLNFSGIAEPNSALHRALSYFSPDIANFACFQESKKDEDPLSQLSSISAKSTEINTPLNVNFLGLVRGTDSLRINALVNANAGLYLSQHVTINTLWNAPCSGITAYDVGGFMDPSSLLSGANLSSMVNTGLGLVSGVATGSTLFWLKVAQFGWNSVGLVRGGLALWRADNKEDEQNYWRLSRIIKRTGDYTGLALQAYQSIKEYNDLEKLYNDTFYPPKNNTDNKQNTEDTQNTNQTTDATQNTTQPEENKPVEKPLDWSEFLEKKGEEIATYDNLKSIGNSFLPGTLTVNAVWGGGNGVNIIPHIIERSVYHNGQNYNLAIDRMVKAHTGQDKSVTLAKSNTVLASGDFEYGATVHGGQNFVHTGGNLTLLKGMNSKATSNHFKSDKKLTGEEGANAKGKSNVFESEDDLLFKGTSEAEKALFKSKNGKAAVAEEATLTIIPSKDREEPGVIVDGKAGSSLGSELNGEGDALVYTKEGHAQVEKTARVDLKGDLTVVGKTADTAEGANIKVKHFHEQGETSATCKSTIQAESGPEAVTIVATKGEAKLDEKAKVTLVPSTEPQETPPTPELKEVPAPSDQTAPPAEKEKPKPRDIIVQGETRATIAGELNGKGNAIAYSKGHAQLAGTAKGSLEGELDVIGKTADGAESATLKLDKMYVQGETSATLSSTLEVPDSPFAVFVIATAPDGKAEITDKAHIHVKPAESQEQPQKEGEPKSEPEVPLPNIVAKGDGAADFKPNITGDARGYVQTKGHADVKPNMDGINLEVDAKTYTLGGKIILSQGKAGLITKGIGTCDENIVLQVGKETAGPNEAEIDAKIAQAKAEALAEQPAPQEPEQTVPQSSEQKSSDTKDPDKELKEKLEDNPNLLSRSQKVKEKDGDQKKEPTEINVKKHLKDNPGLLSRSKKNRDSKKSDTKKDDEKHKHHKKHRKHRHKSKGNDQASDETAPTQPQSEAPSDLQQETTQPETPAEVQTSETQPTEPQKEEEKAPQKPLSEMSVLSFGPMKLNGSIALENGMYQEDRPKEKKEETPEKKEGTEEKKEDTKEDIQDTITPEQRGITYGSNLKLTGGGDLYANTAGAINKEAGSDIGMKNVYIHGDKGVNYEGKTLAEEDSVVTSNGDIFEGETSVTKAGNSASFYAKGKMNKHENATGNAIEFFRHGEQGGELSGALDAARLATFTIDQGKLTVKKSTEGDAANFVIGSYQKPKEPPVAQEQLQTEPVVEAEEEKSGHKKKRRHKKKKHSPNIYSRSQYPPKIEEAMEQEKIGRDNPEKVEVEKPVSDLPPISEAGEVEIEKGATFKGKTMMLRGKGIEHLEHLFTQSGHFKGFDITDYLYVHTDQAVNFAESAKSASKSFEMHTSKVGVAPHVKLKAPEVFKLHSTDHDMTLGHDVKIKAGVYLELLSDKDIVGDFKKRIHRHADGSETVTFEGVTLEGGSGFKYDYIDPKTGLTEERYLGLRVDANGRVLATGMKVMAPSDINVHGFDGIENKGVAQVYVKKVEEESNLWRDKQKVTYETEFFTPEAVSGGKLIMSSENGGLLWQAGGFGVADGADLLFNGHVKLLPLTGWHGHKTTRDTMITFADSETFSKHGLAQSSMFVNAGDATVRIWALNDHDIVAPGFNYSGEKGTLHLKGRWGYFSRVKLKHESRSSSARLDYDVSFFNHMKSVGVLEDAKSFVHNLAQENWKGAAQDAVKPSARAGITWTTSHRKWETLGPGSMSTKDMIVDFSRGMIFDNAYSLSCTGVFTPIKLPYWLIRGANLHSSYSTDTYGIYAGISTTGPSVGANFGHSEGKSNTWVPGNIFIANFNGDADKIILDAAHMHIGKLNESIHEIIARTHKDRSQSKGFNMSVDWSLAGGPNGSASAHYNKKAQANQFNPETKTKQQSGLQVDEVGEKGRIGHAELIGATITGIEPESQTYKPLSKDYDVGGQIGFTAGKSGPQNLIFGFSKDGKQILLNLNVGAPCDKGKEDDEPWRQIGTITVNGVNLPIITQINEQFFKEFGNDLKQLNNKIFGTVQQAVTEYVPPVQPHRQEAWVPIEDEALEDEIVPVDLPPQQESAAVAQMIPVDEPKMVEIPTAPQPVQDDTKNPIAYRPEVIRAVEQVLKAEPAVKPSSFVPFVDSGIEILETPFKYDGITFRYRLRGTNYYIESPELYDAVADMLRHNSTSKSLYVQESYKTFNDPEIAAFYFKDGELKSGDIGRAGKADPNLKGLRVGERTLNGDYIAIANEQIGSTTAHEGAHLRIAQKHGYFLPGRIPGNAEQTERNLANILIKFGEDAKALGMNDFTVVYKPTTIENCLMFDAPWQYFERTFRNNLELQSASLSEPEIRSLIDTAQKNLLNGQLPSQSCDNVYKKAMRAAEQELACELIPLWTEAELHTPGIAKKLAPQTNELIESLYYEGTSKPSGKGWRPNKHTPGFVFLDWALHMGVEKFAHGSDIPTAMVDGTIRTGVDTAIYSPIFYGIGHVAGGPFALGVAGVGIIAEFVPEVTEDDFARVHTDLRDATKKPFSFSSFGQMQNAFDEQENLRHMQAANYIKAGNAKLQELGDWMVDQIDSHFPNLRSESSTFLHAMALLNEQAQLMEYDMINAQWNCRALPKKTHEQIQQEIENYRQKKRVNPKNKDKEDIE